jgi:uncharacterized protein YqfA (UPF0365 family)
MAGVIVSLSQLEVQHMAGGDATRVANGLISAHRAGIPLTFETASAIDLAGRNVLEAVHLSVNPKVVELPPTTGIPQDRVSIRVTGRATLRADLDRLLTGPDESALLTLISERIGLLVNRSPNHRDLLEHPEQIAQDVMESGVDDGAAYRLDALDLAASPA